jgi:hypothetical protein
MEEWYETLQECNSDTTTWAQLVAEFRYRWQWSFPRNADSNPIYSTKPIYLENTARISITISATTTIPAPTKTAAPAIYKTTTTPQRLNCVANTRHVIATSTPILAQPEHKPTTTTANSNTATEQRDNNEPTVEREEEREGKEAEEREELGTEQEKKAEEIWSEVQDPTPSPTAHAAANMMPHEPFNWAAEVDEALGLSPIAPSNSTTPTPINPVPSDVMVDPVRIAFANPVAVTKFRLCLSHSNSTTTPSVHPDPIYIRPARVCAQPVDPDPGDMATNPTGIALAETNTAPANPNRNHNIAPLPTVDPDRAERMSAAPVSPINPDPGDTAADITCPAFPSAEPAVPVPINPIPIHPAFTVPVDPDPVNPNPVTMDNFTPPTHALINCPPITIVHTMPADPVHAGPNAVVCVDPIYITPAEPVHVDPVLDTLINFPIHGAFTSMVASYAHSLHEFCI